MPGIRPPVFYPKWSIAYRLQCLSRALGWTYKKLAIVLGTTSHTFTVYFRTKYHYQEGETVHPRLKLLQRLNELERTYRSPLILYKRHPRKWDRTPHLQRWKPKQFRLSPLPVVKPGDPESVAILAAYRKDEIKRLKPAITEEDRHKINYRNYLRGQRVTLAKIKRGIQERD